MTIMLDISPEAEKRLRQRASLAGVPFPQLLTQLVEQATLTEAEPEVTQRSTETEQRPDENFSDYLERIGIRGAVEGKPREDGRPWSEIEAACDTY